VIDIRIILSALLGPAILTVHNVQAGSAVATDGLGHNIYACGRPVELANQSLLELARRSGWHARIIASSDVTAREHIRAKPLKLLPAPKVGSARLV